MAQTGLMRLVTFRSYGKVFFKTWFQSIHRKQTGKCCSEQQWSSPPADRMTWGGNLPLQEMRTEEAVLLLSITSAPPQQSSQCRSHSDKSRNIRNVLKPKTFPLLRVNHSNSLDAKQPLFSSLCIIWLPLPLCLRTLQWVTAAEVFTDPLLNNPPAKI